MENGQDSKKKDKPIPEEELFDELDAMYQRVADIEKEEATETLTHVEDTPSLPRGTQVIPEKPLRKKSGRNKKRPYRPVILGTIAILFALILGVTLWKPTAILQLLKIGDVQEPTVPPRASPRKPPAVATPKILPAPPAAAPAPIPSPTPSKPPSTAIPPAPPIPPPVATPLAPPNSTSESVPAQTSQEAVKGPKLLPQGRYFAIQVGSFREMENVRGLVEELKKEGLDAYWIASASKKRGALYKVFVGQFMDRTEAAQFQKDRKILKNFPDSFVQDISSSKIVP